MGWLVNDIRIITN